MNFRRLGRTDITVSEICLGTMTFGQQNSEADGHAQLDMALDHGVNFIDTAELYAIPRRPETQGRTEEIIGGWLDKRGGRDRLVISSKVVGRSEHHWFRDDRSPTRLTRAQINEALDKSLKRLRTDYIDLYHVHWADRQTTGLGPNPMIWKEPQRFADETPIEDTLDALGDLVKAGKVRHIALSNETAWGTMRYLALSERHGLPRIQAIQNAYSLVNRTFETNLAEIADREDVRLLAYSPLAQGFLTGKYRDGARPPGARLTLFDEMDRYRKPGAAQVIGIYLDLAAEAGVDPAQMAIAFVLSRPFVTAAIVGATNLDQLKTDLAARDLVLDAGLLARIDEIHRLNANPCP